MSYCNGTEKKLKYIYTGENRGELRMKKELNIMSNMKLIENLKAQLLCIIARFFSLLTKGTNVAQESIIDCISGAIIILYVLDEKLGFSFSEIDKTIKEKVDFGIKSEDPIEKEGKSLSHLKDYITNRID